MLYVGLAGDRGRRTLKMITHHAQPHTDADNETYTQTYPEQSFHSHATIPWCCYHLGHCSLFHVFWPKVGGASPIGYISYNLYAITIITVHSVKTADKLLTVQPGRI